MSLGRAALALGWLAGERPPLGVRAPGAPVPDLVPEAVRYGPCAVRYLIHRDLHIAQSFGGQPQV